VIYKVSSQSIPVALKIKNWFSPLLEPVRNTSKNSRSLPDPIQVALATMESKASNPLGHVPNTGGYFKKSRCQVQKSKSSSEPKNITKIPKQSKAKKSPSSDQFVKPKKPIATKKIITGKMLQIACSWGRKKTICSPKEAQHDQEVKPSSWSFLGSQKPKSTLAAKAHQDWNWPISNGSEKNSPNRPLVTVESQKSSQSPIPKLRSPVQYYLSLAFVARQSENLRRLGIQYKGFRQVYQGKHPIAMKKIEFQKAFDSKVWKAGVSTQKIN